MATHSENPFLSATENLIDPNWYADTPNYNNLINPIDYQGNEMVHVGNNDMLTIFSVGDSSITNGKCLLNLKNVLYMPDIART